MAEHMRLAMEVVESDEELGALVIGDELDRLTAESLGYWQSAESPWSSIPFALHRDIALGLRRIRANRPGDDKDEESAI